MKSYQKKKQEELPPGTGPENKESTAVFHNKLLVLLKFWTMHIHCFDKAKDEFRKGHKSYSQSLVKETLLKYLTM